MRKKHMFLPRAQICNIDYKGSLLCGKKRLHTEYMSQIQILIKRPPPLLLLKSQRPYFRVLALVSLLQSTRHLGLET